MTDNKLGLAILGAGIFALEAHVPAIRACPDIAFKAVYSRSSRTATSFSLDKSVIDLNLDVYHGDDGLEELLKRDDIHAVIVALPIPTQPEIVERALKAGKHVLSEKPVADTIENGQKLIQLYEKEYAPKGLSWRVAENYAHEPIVLRAAELLQSGKSPLGPLLYYDVKAINSVASGSKYHKTEWRAIPQYQGGFLLDGSVHTVAALRVVLGDLVPTQLIGHATLHRTHLGPHDTITALVSSPNITSKPHGEDYPQSEKFEPGQSSPTGTFLVSFASPRTPSPTPQTYTFTCLNGVVILTSVNGKWTLKVQTEDEGVKSFAGQAATEEGESGAAIGVKEEVKQWAEAILGKRGKGEKNHGEPRSALWDVQFLQSALTSQGKPLELAK